MYCNLSSRVDLLRRHRPHARPYQAIGRLYIVCTVHPSNPSPSWKADVSWLCLQNYHIYNSSEWPPVESTAAAAAVAVLPLLGTVCSCLLCAVGSGLEDASVLVLAAAAAALLVLPVSAAALRAAAAITANSTSSAARW